MERLKQIVASALQRSGHWRFLVLPRSYLRSAATLRSCRRWSEPDAVYHIIRVAVDYLHGAVAGPMIVLLHRAQTTSVGTDTGLQLRGRTARRMSATATPPVRACVAGQSPVRSGRG